MRSVEEQHKWLDEHFREKEEKLRKRICPPCPPQPKCSSGFSLKCMSDEGLKLLEEYKKRRAER